MLATNKALISYFNRTDMDDLVNQFISTITLVVEYVLLPQRIKLTPPIISNLERFEEVVRPTLEDLGRRYIHCGPLFAVYQNAVYRN